MYTNDMATNVKALAWRRLMGNLCAALVVRIYLYEPVCSTRGQDLSVRHDFWVLVSLPRTGNLHCVMLEILDMKS